MYGLQHILFTQFFTGSLALIMIQFSSLRHLQKESSVRTTIACFTVIHVMVRMTVRLEMMNYFVLTGHALVCFDVEIQACVYIILKYQMESPIAMKEMMNYLMTFHHVLQNAVA